jgi:hypothetical protein
LVKTPSCTVRVACAVVITDVAVSSAPVTSALAIAILPILLIARSFADPGVTSVWKR